MKRGEKTLLTVRDLTGTEEGLTDFKALTRNRKVNGEKTLSLTVLPTAKNKHSFPMVEEESVIDFDGEEYVIKKLGERSIGNTYMKRIDAIHKFYVDMINKQQPDIHNGSMTFDAFLQFLFTGTGYTYTVLGTFYAQSFENLGNDNRLALLQKGIERYKAEIEIVGTDVRFKDKIGVDTDFQFRYGHNIKSIERNVDTTNLATVISGKGAEGITAYYRSPNADILGEIEASPVDDERFKTQESLLEEMKSRLQDTPEFSITIDFADLRAAGYPWTVPNEGDRVFVIYEPMNDLMIETRIMEINEAYNLKLEPVKTTVTLANYKKTFAGTMFDNVQKQFKKILDESGQIKYGLLDEAVRRATEMLLGSATELEYTENGIVARSKNNPNHLVLVSSTGVGVSVDNGQTFRQAITAEGIVADLITVGTMLFDRVMGGTLTLGGELNGNGRMQVLDENGEVIADLDAGNGGFEWLRIGDVISDSVVKTNLSNLTFYVDPVNGDDENDGFSYSTKKKTIQGCIDSIPKFNAGTINIIVDNNTIKENVIISGFIGDGYIIVDLQNSQVDGNLKIMSNMNRVDFKNGVVNSANETYATVYVSKTTQSAMINLKLYCRNATSYGFSAVDNTFMQLIGCEIYDTNNCIRAGHGSNVYVQNCKGLGDYGVVADYVGAIGGTDSAPAGTVSNTRAIYGGEVRNTFTHDSGERAMPTPPAPPPAPDVTKTWSASSSDNYAMGTYGWVNEGYPKQGNYGYGRRKGLWFFGSDIYNTVNGKNIKRVRVYVKRKSSGGSSSKTTVQIRSHTYASKPGGEPTLSSAYKSISLGWGEGAWIDLPSDFITAFKSGGARGIGVYVASDSSSYYALMEAAAKIEITYS